MRDGGNAPSRVGRLLSSRAGYALTVLIGAAASGACALAVARPWVRGHATEAGLPRIDASVDGADIAPVAGALALVCLAGFGAVIATRGAVRRAVGVVIVACAGVVAALSAVAGSATRLIEDALTAKGWSGGPYESTATAWRALAFAAAVVVVAAGAAVAGFGAHWATMGVRYDSPSEPHPRAPTDGEGLTDAAMWRALDDGDDPTRDG
jgi:uncharacterized membrane protein (TIGR02234 family)